MGLERVSVTLEDIPILVAFAMTGPEPASGPFFPRS